MDTKLNKLIELVKESLRWSQIYWNRSHQYGSTEYSEQEINEAFNKWNWADRDLKDFISLIQYGNTKEETAKKEETMDNKDRMFTRITCENSKGEKTIVEYAWQDANADDYIQAIVTIMTSATFTPRTILEKMYEYSKDALKALGDEEV